MAEREQYDDAYKAKALADLEAEIKKGTPAVVTVVAARWVRNGSPDQTLRNWMTKAGLKPPSQRQEYLDKLVASGARLPGGMSAHAASNRETAQDFGKSKNRTHYNSDFKSRAVATFEQAIRDNVQAPLKTVAASIEVHPTVLSGWLVNAGYGIEESSSTSSALDWDKIARLRSTAQASKVNGAVSLHRQPEFQPPADPIIIQLRAMVPPGTDPIEAIRGMIHANAAMEGEITALRSKVESLEREREAFIQTTTLLGSYRQSGQ